MHYLHRTPSRIVMPASFEDTKTLLLRIASFERLQVVLSLADQPRRAWTLEELAASSGVDADRLAACIDELVTAGILDQHACGACALAGGVAEDARALLELYRDNPLPVVQVLTDRAIDRVRTAAARTFADAFVIRRNGGG